MQISKLAREMPVSPIRNLTPLANKAKANGIDVIHLNIGQPDIETPREFLDAIIDAAKETKVVSYLDSAGYRPLREAMSGYFKSLGFPYDADDILVTHGGSEALLFIFMTCLNPGEEVLVPEPLYANYISFTMPNGVKIAPIPTTKENNFALPPYEELVGLVNDKTKAILVSNPGNPTGAVMTQDELDRLATLAMDNDLYIIADELYRELTYDGKTPTSFAAMPEIEDRVVFVDSVSKRYSNCGARIGCVATKNSEVRAGVLKFCQGRLAATSLEMMASVALYNMRSDHFDKVRETYQERRDIFIDRLNQIEGVSCYRPGGAFYTICKLPVKDAEAFAAWLLSEFSIDGRTLMVAPAPAFYMTPGVGKDEVRVAYVRDIPDLLAACELLEEALKVYPDRV